MELNRLKQIAREAYTHQLLLGNYPGRATVGITTDGDGKYALVIHIQSNVGGSFPRALTVDNEQVSVLVRDDFIVPALN